MKQLIDLQFWRGQWQKVWQGWCHFWFSPVDLYNVSLFRLVLGLSLLVMYSIRASEFQYFFTSAGVMPTDQALAAMPPGYQSPFPFFLTSDSGIAWQCGVHLVLIALFALGVFGRSLTWLLFAINLGLNQRNISIVYGADLFGNFWLFYLSFIDHNRHFSVLNYFRRSVHKGSEVPPGDVQSDLFSSMGVRLIQIQLCLSYAYTGIEKLKGSVWWEGTAVWHVIGMDDLIPHDLAFMQNFPVVLALLSMATIIFEIYFVFAVWNQKLKWPWLMVGFLFHLSTAIFIDLHFFFLVITSAYLVFLPPLKPWVQRWRALRVRPSEPL
jgi:hypothetical protein